jgi:hypothetical protein
MASQMKNTAPASIQKLVETFEKNLGEYRSSKNETELRREFLDKFFTALGWDVDNLQGAREAEKEVAHEFSVEIDGQQKKADYAFRIKRDSAIAEKFDFLVEAKKPSVKIETDLDAAFQIRRYGWSARIPINILTDFEHFAVYDCRVKPKYGEKAVLNRQMLFHYKEYIEKWDEIVNLFSPEAIRAGSLNEYVKSIKGKKGTADVDDDFLQEIERWRELLAKNIASNNEWIDISGLNYAVQMIIDRIIFLRICEERSIEPENQLQDITNKENIYKELCSLFKRADTKYNSGLFHFAKESGEASRADDLTLRLEIDDKTLKDIILNLYYPKSPYAFLYIPSDILGQVYERFLGKVIRLTDGHRAKVEEKPEVRKAGGVFYTPTFIVTYIVINTLGKLLIGLTPKEAVKLKIVDPACGSGTFLLGAFEYLLAWHLKWYSENDPEKWVKNKVIVKVGNDYRLTTAKKKEILLNNIYGVDIDAQAVEVTKLSLLLKVLENASGQLELGMERILPDLGNNIKCGNSLVSEDYFSEFPEMISQEERNRINPFNWESAFPEVFVQGGFNAVIGNPPYVEISGIEWDDRRYYEKAYSVKGRFDLYTLFILKATQICRQDGYWGFVIPNKFATNLQFSEVRHNILQTFKLDSLLSYDGLQFKNAGVNSIVICCHKQKPIPNDNVTFLSWSKGSVEIIGQQEQSALLTTPSYNFSFVGNNKSAIVDKVKKNSVSFETFFDVKDGIVAGEIKENLFAEKKIDSDSHKLFFGRGLQRYSLVWTGKWVNYKPQEMMELEIKSKGKKRPGLWMRDKSIFEAPKILTRKVATHIIATFDSESVYYEQTLHGSILRANYKNYDEKYFLGILNSLLIKYYYQSSVQQEGKLFPQIRINILKSLPMPPINFSDPVEKSAHDKMVSLVNSMLALHKSLASAQNPFEKERLEKQIKSADEGIDKLVYELYGLSEEEIKLVEGK